MAHASKKSMGGNVNAQHGVKKAGKDDVGEHLDEFDIADEIQGRNSLQGDDQHNVPNERQAQAGATGETEGVIESFEKSDPRKRSGNKKKD